MRLFPGIFLLILPLLLSIPSILFLFDNTLVLFPNPRYTGSTESYVSQNSTIVNFDVRSKRLSFSYILRPRLEGELPPYSSMVIWLVREDIFLDLSAYEYLSLEIERSTRDKAVIFIKTFEKGVSNPEKDKALSLRHNECTLSITPDVSSYSIKIRDFVTPDWWFNMLEVPRDKRGEEGFTRVAALDLQFIHRDSNPPPDKEEELIVKNIAFQKAYPIFYIFLNIGAALYTIFLVLALATKRKRIMGFIYDTPRIQYKRRELPNYADSELRRVMKYLEEHYSDPEVSASIISRETGIPRPHIAALVKDRYDFTCKQLINNIRITEAKRLLKETDRRILEIALEVGFEDISTFNRCFKQEEGITPRQYRSS